MSANITSNPLKLKAKAGFSKGWKNISVFFQWLKKTDSGISAGMTTLAIDKMTVAEKLWAMEQLWDDFCRQAEPMQSPDWHRDVLLIREEQVKYGTSSFLDWSEAKKRIQDHTS